MTIREPATVIYNPNAGRADSVDLDEILSCLSDQGYAATCPPTDDESDLDDILRSARGLVVVCGGDGTFGAALRRAAGREDLEVAYLPLGTANNLGHSLGLPMGSLDAIRYLKMRPRRKMDLGYVELGGDRATFAEGFGCGVFAEILHMYDPELGKSVMRALESLAKVLREFEPVHIRARVDGEDVSGEYLMFAVLNTKRIGPRIELAPDADPFDGSFDVIGVKPDKRPTLLQYIGALMGGDKGERANGLLRKGRRIEIAPAPVAFHLDTLTYKLESRVPPASETDHEIRVGVLPHMVTIVCAAPE